MDHIKGFNRLNEKMGIAESTLFYVDLITFQCLYQIFDYVAKTRNYLRNDSESLDITLSYRDVRKYVTDWGLYTDFPISEIGITMDLHKKTDLDEDDGESDSYRVGGYASMFAKGREKRASRIKDPIRFTIDHSLSIHIGIDFSYDQFFNRSRVEKKLKMEIESVILHELNHSYEHYKRKINGYSPMNTTLSMTAFTENTRRRPSSIWNYWSNKFCNYIYMTELHEMRAMVHEAKAFVDKMSFESFQKTKIWKEVKTMSSFNKDKFLVNFNRVIRNHNESYVDLITKRLINDFINEYESNITEFKVDPVISISTLRKMSMDEFLDYWCKRIKVSGEKVKKKILKLYSYKGDEEQNLIN